jgi:predicted nuclease with TOPRIM domain
MRKTAKIENQLLEMIQPRIQLIENKFSNGEALSDQDVNTLLLKSAFNHMNHFDLRLDEVAADVAQLRTDFCGLEGRFHALEGRFKTLEAKFTALEAKFTALEGKFHALEGRFQELENRFLVLEGKFQTLEAKFETLEARFISFESRMEAIIEKTMKSNIKWTLGLMTFCLTLFKIIDLVVQN